jgi:hypothetical protein
MRPETPRAYYGFLGVSVLTIDTFEGSESLPL